jgi:hypothetical protein
MLGACGRSEASGTPTLSRAVPLASPSAERAIPTGQPTRVSLSGELQPASGLAREPGPGLYSKAARTWIYAEPRASASKLGYLRSGAFVSAASTPAGHEGCAGGWFAIAPRGFVCAGAGATFDDSDPVVQATRETPPDLARKLPYIYGMVRKPGPIYRRLPDAAQALESEPGLETRLSAWLEAPGEIGASYAQYVWLGRPGLVPDPAVALRERRTEGVPGFLASNRALPTLDGPAASSSLIVAQMRPRAGYSFLRTLLWNGRRFGLATDLTLSPTDRFRPIQGSEFHGVEIGKDIDFPFAFVRSPEARFWQAVRGTLEDAGPAPYRAALKLTGKQRFFRGRLHFELENGKWLSDEHGSRLDPVKRMPGWGKSGERWLDVNLSKQTLVAYDGTRPVYATMISSGEAGLEDHEHTTATKRGIFRIHTKHVTTTMSSDEAGEEYELRDVPYVQYFEEGYALHGAYWHDRFGIPKSHGCLNLSPEDARRLFFFTEPSLPEGWHGVLMPLRGSVVFVHP